MTNSSNFSSSRLIPYSFAKNKGLILVNLYTDYAEIALRQDATPETLAEAKRVLGVTLKANTVSTNDFEKLLTLAYAQDSAAGLAENIESDIDLSKLLQELPAAEDLLETGDGAPVIRMINAILTQALTSNASDIHIEPYETRSVVRFRIDGAMRNIIEPHRGLHAAMVSRLKVMAQLDIAEKRLPQDGRITLRIAGKAVDVRVSTLPTGHGERVVLRILEKDSNRMNLTSLGMSDGTLTKIDNLIHQSHGIILVTGPTGSGKTTTLYSALSRVDASNLNIMTVEDPIEYDLPKIAQTQVNTRIDMSFAKALRSILRQDPDVIMIGEIRDVETAQIAVQASLTGHLVLATLHTNDSVAAIARLMDMGVEPFLLASSLSGVLAQRLVRKLCPHCKLAETPDTIEQQLMNLAPNAIPQLIYRAVGCAECHGTGYIGRTGIYELLTMDDHMRKLVYERASEQALKQHAIQQGMLDLRADGVRWVMQGITSLEELLSVAGD
jgi:general secretion pathway protein E